MTATSKVQAAKAKRRRNKWKVRAKEWEKQAWNALQVVKELAKENVKWYAEARRMRAAICDWAECTFDSVAKTSSVLRKIAKEGRL